MDIGLSMVTGCSCRDNHFNGKWLDIYHPGRERVNVLRILQKFQISPPMDGYALVDVLAHPKLLRSKTKTPLPDETYVNPLSSPSAIAVRVKQEMVVLQALVKDQNFVIGQLALSKSCDLPLRFVVERGQQTRIVKPFMRRYYEESLYIDETTLAKPFVVVRKPRSQSSWADPPWLENPRLDTLHTRSSKEEREEEEEDAESDDGDDDNAWVRSPPKVLLRKRKAHVDLATMFLGSSKAQKLQANKEKSAKAKTKTKKAYSGGVVFKPCPNFYDRPEDSPVVLDFASLYPSIIIGSRICYMRVIYDRKWLDDPKCDLEYIPLDDDTCGVMIKAYDGVPVRTITDVIMMEIAENRKRVRRAMKKVSDPFRKQSMNAQQLSCKVVQNSAYGFLGSTTSGMTCMLLAAATCCIGQHQNKVARYESLKSGCFIVYGDTDSIMVIFPLDLTSEPSNAQIAQMIYTKATTFAARVTKLYPAPNELECEARKFPMLQTDKKKTYGALEWANDAKAGKWVLEPKRQCKGFVFKKRDHCLSVNAMGDFMADNILYKNPTNDLITHFKSVVDGFDNNPQVLEPYVITCNLGTVYKTDDSLALVLAEAIEVETGSRPLPGRRLAFVMSRSKKKKGKVKNIEKIMTPSMFMKSPKVLLCHTYYLRTQLYQAIAQFLCLPIHAALLARLKSIVDDRIRYFDRKESGQRLIMSYAK